MRPLIHHDDAVGLEHGGESMRDDQGCASAHQALEAVLDRRFGLRIEIAGGFVEQQDR